MMIRTHKYKLLACAAVWVLTIFVAPVASAESMTPDSGITVSPALLDITLGATGTETEQAFRVRNNQAFAVELQAELAGLAQIGARLVPSGQADPSVIQAVSIRPGTVRLEPKAAANVVVVVRNNPELPPGGHYVSILLRFIGGSNPNSQSVSLNASIGVGLFITKTDGLVRSVDASIASTNGWLFRLPSAVDVQIVNRGNVLVTPRGSINIANNQHIVKSTLLNQESISLLPGKDVRLRTAFTSSQAAWLPGRYNLIVSYRAEGDTTTKTVSSYVWYIPPYLLIVPLGAAAIIYIYWRVQKRRHTSRRSILTQASEKSNTSVSTHPIPTVAQSKVARGKRIVVQDVADGEKITIRKK